MTLLIVEHGCELPELIRAAELLPNPNLGRHQGPCRVGAVTSNGSRVLLEYHRVESRLLSGYFHWALMGALPDLERAGGEHVETP